jgi:SLT domain-containing protein
MLSGEGVENVRAAIRAALDHKGIIDPAARVRWESGMMLISQRESGFRDVVNGWDANARAGNPSAGPFQFTRTTFDIYHEPGTPTDFRDTFAQACALVNYAHSHYKVSLTGIDLAEKLQQADPLRPARGY